MIGARVRRRLVAALGEDAVEQRSAHEVVVGSSGIEALRRAMEILVEERVPFAPIGEGRSVTFALGVRAPRGVFDVWPEELVVRVGAGTTLAELDAVLAPHGLELGLADGAWPDTSLGAVFAAGDRGLRGRFGEGLRERALACTFVDGRAVVRRSGARVVKNVAGFDLTRLHHGARGSLGVVADLTLRVSARRSAVGVVALECAVHELVERVQWSRGIALDAACELWIDEGASAASGLPARCHLVTMREAPADGLERWARALGSPLRDASLLRAIGATRWRDASNVLRVDSVTVRRVASRAPSGLPAGCTVVDLLAGEAWWCGSVGAHDAAKALLGLGGAVFDENPRASGVRGTRTDPVRATHERRLRAVFDPYALLPAAPSPLVRHEREVGA